MLKWLKTKWTVWTRKKRWTKEDSLARLCGLERKRGESDKELQERIEDRVKWEEKKKPAQ